MADFEVEEQPKYSPCGEGEHLYLWLEKRDTSGIMLRRMLANTLDISARDIGMAGLKDRRAVTRQWVSVPRSAAARVSKLEGPRLRVLDARAHTNKLRTGHLAGNHFRVVLRGTTADAVARVTDKLELLSARGVPNFYGGQRMGRGGSTLAAGWALSRGEQRRARVAMPDGSLHQLNLRDRQLKRLSASALQSELFNRVLARRLNEGTLERVLLGDMCRKRDTGGTFPTDDPGREQRRLDAGEIVLTGPMWGPKMPRPTDEALAFEAEVCEACGLDDAAFRRIGHLASGARRALVVWPTDVSVTPLEDRDRGPDDESGTPDAAPDEGVVVRFTLPAGSFATVLLHELVGPLSDAERDRYGGVAVAPGAAVHTQGATTEASGEPGAAPPSATRPANPAPTPNGAPPLSHSPAMTPASRSAAGVSSLPKEDVPCA